AIEISGDNIAGARRESANGGGRGVHVHDDRAIHISDCHGARAVGADEITLNDIIRSEAFENFYAGGTFAGDDVSRAGVRAADAVVRRLHKYPSSGRVKRVRPGG